MNKFDKSFYGAIDWIFKVADWWGENSIKVVGCIILGYAAFLGWKLGDYIDHVLGEYNMRSIVYGTLVIAFVLIGQAMRNKRKRSELETILPVSDDMIISMAQDEFPHDTTHPDGIPWNTDENSQRMEKYRRGAFAIRDIYEKYRK